MKATAAKRGIRQHDPRQSATTRAVRSSAPPDVTAMVLPGVVGAYESSAEFDLIETPKGSWIERLPESIDAGAHDVEDRGRDRTQFLSGGGRQMARAPVQAA